MSKELFHMVWSLNIQLTIPLLATLMRIGQDTLKLDDQHIVVQLFWEVTWSHGALKSNLLFQDAVMNLNTELWQSRPLKLCGSPIFCLI